MYAIPKSSVNISSRSYTFNKYSLISVLLCPIMIYSFPTCLIRFLNCTKIPIKPSILKKKKFKIHWLELWWQTFFNKWDIIIDLRGSLISYLLFNEQKYIYK